MPLERVPFKKKYDLEGLGPAYAIRDWSTVPVAGSELCLFTPAGPAPDGHISWEPATPFHGVLEIQSLGSKKDGYRVTVLDRRIDRWYSLHVRDFFATLKKVDVRNNTLDGLFKYVYKYGSYGITAA